MPPTQVSAAPAFWEGQFNFHVKANLPDRPVLQSSSRELQKPNVRWTSHRLLPIRLVTGVPTTRGVARELALGTAIIMIASTRTGTHRWRAPAGTAVTSGVFDGLQLIG